MTIGVVLVILGVIFLLSFMITSIIEALLGIPFEKFPALKQYKWALIYVAVGAGIAGAFLFKFDLLYLCGQFLADIMGVESVIPITPYGMTLTGASIGMGAGHLHDLVSKYFKKPDVP